MVDDFEKCAHRGEKEAYCNHTITSPVISTVYQVTNTARTCETSNSVRTHLRTTSIIGQALIDIWI